MEADKNIKFRRFCSIENAYRTSFVQHAHLAVRPETLWYVTDKVHGQNLSFHTDGVSVRTASRNNFVDPDSFSSVFLYFDEIKNKILSLFISLKAQHPQLTQLSMYGEHFGGHYPHPDVPKVQGVTKIQNGVWYSPNNHFYGFDIIMFFDGNTNVPHHLSVPDRNWWFESLGIFYAKPLFVGSLSDCLQYPNIFKDPIPSWLGLPEIDCDNICEGVVIEPAIPTYLASGERIIIKNKNALWAENKGGPKLPKDEIKMSEVAESVLEAISEFVTENRLRSVLSKTPLTSNKDFGKVMGEFTVDSLEDALKDPEIDQRMSSLVSTDQKCVRKGVNLICAKMLRENIHNILDGTF